MSVFNRIEEIVRNTDTTVLDQHWAWDTDPVQIATELYDAVRTEAAADVHRAELPTFPADEKPEIVAKTVRAVDVRLAAQGPEAPYGRDADAAPDFFLPGRTYTRQCHGDTAEFRVQYIGADPEFGDRQAFGWYRRRPRTSWHPYSQDEAEFVANGWTEVTEGGEAR